MAQIITDYVKFLTDARNAVDCLNCDKNTRNRVAAEEKQLRLELSAVERAVADNVNQTVKNRLEAISTTYNEEIDKCQEELKKIKARREKARSQGVKSRIEEETRQLRGEKKELEQQKKVLFRQSKAPTFCGTDLYYSLYLPKGVKEYGILLVALLVCFLLIPCGGYLLIPKHRIWQLVLIYFLDIVVFGLLYVAVGNHTKETYRDVLREGRELRSQIEANQKEVRRVTRKIRRDKNDKLYKLEKYDDEIARKEQELSEIQKKKKDAVNTFETVTKNIISDEIRSGSQQRIDDLKKRCQESKAAMQELDQKIKQQNMQITDTYGPYLDKEFLQFEKLSELSRLIQTGAASNLTEAMEQYRKLKK